MGADIKFLSKIPESDKGYWMVSGNPAIIIKGEIIVPRAAKVVEKYELP